MNVMRWFITLC